MKQFAVLAAFLMPVACAVAQSTEPDDFAGRAVQERARIAAERDMLQQRLPDEERACYQRFAVNDCLRQTRRAHRRALADLRRQELAINEQERQRQGAERLRSLEQRATEVPPRTEP